MDFKVHLFVCTNAPDRPGKCGHKGSEKLRDELKKRCREAFGNCDVRVNASGCLGHCEEGITAVIYPQGKWFFHLKPEDNDRLFREVADLLTAEDEKKSSKSG